MLPTPPFPPTLYQDYFLCSFCISLASFPPPDTNCSSCVKYDMAIKQFSILNLITLVGFCFCMSQFMYSCTVFLGAWASSGINHQFRVTKNTQIHMCTHTHTHTHTHTQRSVPLSLQIALSHSCLPPHFANYTASSATYILKSFRDEEL